WGEDNWGSLGDGRTADSHVPEKSFSCCCGTGIPWEMGVSDYSQPSPFSAHAADSRFPFEQVDLFTGGLSLSYEELRFPGNAGHDLVIPRWYSSKVKLTDPASGYKTGVEASSYGYGWQMHLGRLY